MKQREIIFKAWHNELKIMLYPPSGGKSVILCEDSNGNGVKIDIDGKKQPIPAHMTWKGKCYANGRLQNLLWLQYTGLNDKNGKEIYEGDIVRHSISEGHEWAGVHQVVFSDGAFKLKGGNPHGMRYGEIFNFFPHNVEVVGNVFENPEILKEWNNEK